MTQTTMGMKKQTIRQKLQSISDYFDLGKITATPRRTMGTNQNYFVTTDQGRFLFKIIVNTTREDIEQGLPYLDRLEDEGFPAAYYLKAADGSLIFQSADYFAVVVRKLRGSNPWLNEHVCREVGYYLATLHQLSADALPAKRHWLDNDYLPEAITLLQQTIGEDKLKETLAVYNSFNGFAPATLPQSIVHGDLDVTNCLFTGKKLSAFLDWQEIGVGASILDFAMTVVGFCFVDEDPGSYYWATFNPDLYKALYESYTAVRPFTSAERDALPIALKYTGLTQPVWAMLHWDIYHAGQEVVETNTLYWKFGLDTLSLPSL